ncbi:hypothetical protein ACOSQ4_031349 [Xanthoceras sorbifolium]
MRLSHTLSATNLWWCVVVISLIRMQTFKLRIMIHVILLFCIGAPSVFSPAPNHHRPTTVNLVAASHPTVAGPFVQLVFRYCRSCRYRRYCYL